MRAELVEQIVGMGFGRAEAERALALCGGDFDDAIEALTRPNQPKIVPFGTAAPGRPGQQSLGMQDGRAIGWRRPLASLSPPAATKRKAAAPCSSPSSSKKLA